MTKFLTLFLAGAFITCVSQTTTYSVQLFYNLNESLSAKNAGRLDSFCAALPVGLAKISITGYADFLYSDNYNLSLSQKRANGVKDQLLQRPEAKQFTIISSTGMGESVSKDNGSKTGEPARRRVDVVVELQAPIITNKQPAAPSPEKEKTQVVVLEKLKAGEKLELEGLSFEPGRHILLKSSWPVLKKLLQTLKDNPAIKIEIHGHVCCAPDSSDSYDFDTKDQKLSKNRAQTVYEYLVRNGIDEKRLSYKGFGHSRPKVKELSIKDEQVNRRVEIQVTETEP